MVKGTFKEAFKGANCCTRIGPLLSSLIVLFDRSPFRNHPNGNPRAQCSIPTMERFGGKEGRRDGGKEGRRESVAVRRKQMLKYAFLLLLLPLLNSVSLSRVLTERSPWRGSHAMPCKAIVCFKDIYRVKGTCSCPLGIRGKLTTGALPPLPPSKSVAPFSFGFKRPDGARRERGIGRLTGRVKNAC